MTLPLPRGTALAAIAVLAVVSCSPKLRVRTPTGAPVEVQAVAVHPFVFRWDEPAYRSYELSQRMALQILETRRYAVYGPGEFKVAGASPDSPFAGNDLLLGSGRGVPASSAMVFRPSAERRTQSELKQVFDLRGAPKGTERVEVITVVARLEVTHAGTGEPLTALEAVVDVDPFAARDHADPLPELTETIDRMTARALDELRKRAPGRRIAHDPGFEALWCPGAALDFKTEGELTYRATLDASDALDREVLLETRLRFFYPKAGGEQMARLKALPYAVLSVTSAGEAAASGLARGDLIYAIEGEVASPQALNRALRLRGSELPIRVKVRRGARLLDLAIAVRR